MSSVFAEARFNFSLNVAEKDFAASSPPLVQGLHVLHPALMGAAGLSLQPVAAPHFKYCLYTKSLL